MKAFLLAAGHGTRLRPLTDTTPKCLLPVRGVPLLDIWLNICRDVGIEDVLINVHSHSSAVAEFLQSRQPPPKVQLVEERELLGSAGTLIANRSWVDSEDFFWVFYADVLHRANLHAMLDIQKKRKPAATLGVYRVPDPMRCGIVDMAEDGTVQAFVEKPERPQSNLAFAGIMLATSDMLDAIPPKVPADIGFDVLPRLAGRMVAYSISEYLIDIGTMHNYQEAQVSWPGM